MGCIVSTAKKVTSKILRERLKSGGNDVARGEARNSIYEVLRGHFRL